MLHMLNTSGVINYPKAQFNMVRIGIGLYGFGNNKKETAQLKNTHNLKSIISQIHTIEKGETVGYNRAFTANKQSKTATIPIGHADGLSRKLGNKKGFVLINNKKAPIVGNVCMDMIMVDVTDVPCAVGDVATLIGTDGAATVSTEQVAERADLSPYELLVGLALRVPSRPLASSPS